MTPRGVILGSAAVLVVFVGAAFVVSRSATPLDISGVYNNHIFWVVALLVFLIVCLADSKSLR
jgi:hypothetical protein